MVTTLIIYVQKQLWASGAGAQGEDPAAEDCRKLSSLALAEALVLEGGVGQQGGGEGEGEGGDDLGAMVSWVVRTVSVASPQVGGWVGTGGMRTTLVVLWLELILVRSAGLAFRWRRGGCSS